MTIDTKLAEMAIAQATTIELQGKRIKELEGRVKELQKKEITDRQAALVARAFWRRIYPYIYEPNQPPYPKEFGKKVPVEFQASMATALCALDMDGASND